MFVLKFIRILSFSFITFLSVLIVSVYGTKRHINCVRHSSESEKGIFNLAYIRADGSEDTIHYLWSTYNLPSVIIARTTSDTKVNLDIDKLKTFEKGAITFSKSPLASIGLTISELWQLSYETDMADIKKPSNVESLDLLNFQWSNMTNETLSCSDTSAFINLQAYGDNPVFSNNGLFELQFSVLGNKQAAQDFPHLIYTGNSTQIKVALNNLYLKNSTRIRYGLEIHMFSPLMQSCPVLDCKAVTTTLVSDEFSPGIFSDVDILSPCSQEDSEKGSFLTWRPVAYTSKEPSVANSSDAKLTSDCSFTDISRVESIAGLFYNDQKNTAVNIFNVTFGTKGDGFYPKTEYVTWSLMLGTGLSVHTKLSITAIVFISVGMAALLFFSVLAGIYYAAQYFRKKPDLLLAESSVN